MSDEERCQAPAAPVGDGAPNVKAIAKEIVDRIMER